MRTTRVVESLYTPVSEVKLDALMPVPRPGLLPDTLGHFPNQTRIRHGFRRGLRHAYPGVRRRDHWQIVCLRRLCSVSSQYTNISTSQRERTTTPHRASAKAYVETDHPVP